VFISGLQYVQSRLSRASRLMGNLVSVRYVSGHSSSCATGWPRHGTLLMLPPCLTIVNTSALPLFPLHTVLFPGGLLPLQIFEVRYLDLMKRCEKSGEPFGVVCLQSGSEVRRAPRQGESVAATETFAATGTLATLEQVTQPQAGLMVVLARGGQRFRLERAHVLPHGLWMGEVELLPDDAPTAVPEELASLGPRLQRALKAIVDDGTTTMAMALPPFGDPCWQDAGWLSNRWVECLPLPAQERQRLMSLDNPLWRLELVAEWLERLERISQQSGRA
jgi:Lon protease-like protein